MLGLNQADHDAGDVIYAPRALFVRISRILEGVAGLTSDSDLGLALSSDAIIAKAGSKAHRWSSWSAAVVDLAGRNDHAAGATADWGTADFASKLNEFPWVVWQLTLNDPKGLAGQDVAERTEAIAKKVADLYGCVYEDCVDADEYADGTKYYRWLIAVKQSEHRTPILLRGQPASDVPQVVGELYAELCAVLPEELRGEDEWEVAPHLWATLARNPEDRG